MIAGRATSFAAASASGPQVGPRPFADQVPLELGQRREDVKYQLAGCI